ncbi:MAG: CotH kinase family protein, partial [Firmicutes bacterium]|nr:CotH kinase family protein [Bacillota bacterium]
YEQKSYRIKFDSKTALFGEPLSKHWVIVPGANDFSSTRNNAAFTITANVLSNIEYTSSVHIVEVYINGNYHGVYSVLEQVRVADDRVNIASDYGVLDTGYLVEYDAYAEGTQGIYNFAINGLKYKFSMKSPDPDEYAASVTETVYRSQVTYIQNYMQQLTTAILRRNYSTILSLVDINSVVDMYIIHELFKNTDTGWSSCVMYKKPGDKVFFGPIWDFDFSAGISRGDSSTSGLYVSDTVRNYSDFTSSEMYISLMRIASFVSLVKARYIAIHNQITQQINAVFDEAARYTESYARDATQWTWHYNWESDQIYVKDWLLTRNDWMYSWAGGQ